MNDSVYVGVSEYDCSDVVDQRIKFLVTSSSNRLGGRLSYLKPNTKQRTSCSQNWTGSSEEARDRLWVTEPRKLILRFSSKDS